MNHARPGFLLALVLAAPASFAVGAEESAPNGATISGPPPAREERPAISTPSPSTPADPAPPTGATSSDRLALLKSAMPKFEALPAPKPAEEQPDLRETDKPRNTIVRLPPYLVPDAKPLPPIKERELMTPQEKLKLALKKHPGLRVGSLPFLSNNGIAMAMLEEEERLEKKREFEDLASLMRLSDPAAAAKAKQEVDRAFTRKADFGR